MKKFNLLLVDDIENNIYTLRLIIEEKFKNINIISAPSAQDAVFEIMKHDIDLILCDIQMPGINGFELIQYLNDIEQTNQIPIILITAIYNDKESIQKGYDVGAIDYLTKPIDDELLCSKLNVYLNIYENKKEDKKKINTQEEVLKTKQIKINTMIDELNRFSPHIKNSLTSSTEFLDLIDEDDTIDLTYIIKD